MTLSSDLSFIYQPETSTLYTSEVFEGQYKENEGLLILSAFYQVANEL